MNLKPLGDRLIVEVLDEEDVTTSGIGAAAGHSEGEGRSAAASSQSARAAGMTTASSSPWDLEDGDEIVFSKYGGTEIKVGVDEYLILRESDVLAKVVGTRELAGAKS